MTSLTDINGEVIRELPVCDFENPAELEGWFGPYGFFEHLRKIVLSNAREIVRAKELAGDGKIGDIKLTDPRRDDLARQSDAYMDFVILNLRGRILREQNVRDSNRTG